MNLAEMSLVQLADERALTNVGASRWKPTEIFAELERRQRMLDVLDGVAQYLSMYTNESQLQSLRFTSGAIKALEAYSAAKDSK